MITKKQFIEYLLSTPINYTCTNLAKHLEGVSHDSISDVLSNSRFTPRALWELVKEWIEDSEEAFLMVADSVQDKRYWHSIELVKRQYSGKEHGLGKGIGLVNLLHSTGLEGEFCPIDYRVYAPQTDGKTKHEHFQEMFIRAVTDKQIKARRIAFDSWYAGEENLKLIDRSGWTFFRSTEKQSQSLCQ
jgi:hypothetical protein